MSSGMWWLIAVILVIAVIVFLVLGRRKQNEATQEPAREDPFANVTGAREFGPDILGPGAIVTRGGTDYVVRGTLTITEGYYTWYEHMLEGGNGSEYLSVEVDEGRLNLSWWVTRGDLRLEPRRDVNVDGVDYHLNESGRATFTSEGETGLPPQGQVAYHDMEATDGSDRMLGMERFGDGQWEASLGHEVLPGELTIYPAPKQ